MIGNMLVAFAHVSEILMVGRTLGGLGFGAHVVQIPMYCSEIIQPGLRQAKLLLLCVAIPKGLAKILHMRSFDLIRTSHIVYQLHFRNLVSSIAMKKGAVTLLFITKCERVQGCIS